MKMTQFLIHFCFDLAAFNENAYHIERELNPLPAGRVGGLQRSRYTDATLISAVRVHLLPSATEIVLIGIPLKRIIPIPIQLRIHTAAHLHTFPAPAPRGTGVMM